jgi:hypothetical protein
MNNDDKIINETISIFKPFDEEEFLDIDDSISQVG